MSTCGLPNLVLGVRRGRTREFLRYNGKKNWGSVRKVSPTQILGNYV